MATHAPIPTHPIAGDEDGGALPRHQSASWAPGVPWIGVAVLTLAAALVFWLFDALPFQDLPGHAGLIALRHRYAHSPFDQRYYVYSPHLGPYSLFRALGEWLIVPLGPVGAVRALATLPMVLTPFAVRWARLRLHGDRSTSGAYFGLALGFGFMTILGFASYLLGVTLLIIGVTMWLELMALVDSAPRSSAGDAARGGARVALAPIARQEITVACFAPFLFLAHGHAFVLFLLVAGVSTLVTGNRVARLLRVRALAPGVALAAWCAWRERASSWPAGAAPVPHPPMAPHFQGAWDKLSLLITPTLLTRTGVDAVVGVAMWTALTAATIVTARAIRREAGDRSGASASELASTAHARALLGAVAVITAAFLALPHSIGWFGFVDGRLVPVIMFLALMAVRRETLGRTLRTAFDVVGPIAAFAMVIIALVASYAFQREAEGWREVLAEVPAEARLLNLPLQPNSRVFTAHPFVHYDKLVMASRPVLVSDVWYHQGTSLYPTAENPTLALPGSYSESNLRSIDWGSYRLTDWDYVLIRMRPDSPGPAVPPGLVLDLHRGGWWLYRVNPNGRRAP